ncbi:unnamed protein product [Spirodela intermedia]|uniref:N-acetyltransferase domain-containing protein n=1 Tax=Spirodela intermedia TaxID=51605 RepID=A0A7I8LIT0_SPIIN|nr:unnamed protein product [Spirodela intermedia]
MNTGRMATAFPAVHRRRPPVVAAIFSTPDEELERRGLSLRRTAAGLDIEALNSVFFRAGFPRRDPVKIRRALENSPSMVWLADGSSGRPVAFARAAGDGVFNAVVWDVAVDPDFQGLGLGKAVMERLVEDLRSGGVCNIALYAEPKVVGFYRPLGFAADPDGIKGMVYARKQPPPLPPGVMEGRKRK